MSTRGLVGIRTNGYDHGFYNHCDSYPDGLGVEVVNFVRGKLKPEFRQTFLTNFQNIQVIEDSHGSPTEENFLYYQGILGNEIGGGLGFDRAKTDWYALLRSYQGVGCLEAILDGTLKHRVESIEFIKDSLFCEYAYILNFDDGALEFWKGFQEVADQFNRFGTASENGYFPCKVVGSVPFDQVSTQTMRSLFPHEED